MAVDEQGVEMADNMTIEDFLSYFDDVAADEGHRRVDDNLQELPDGMSTQDARDFFDNVEKGVPSSQSGGQVAEMSDIHESVNTERAAKPAACAVSASSVNAASSSGERPSTKFLSYGMLLPQIHRYLAASPRATSCGSCSTAPASLRRSELGRRPRLHRRSVPGHFRRLRNRSGPGSSMMDSGDAVGGSSMHECDLCFSCLWVTSWEMTNTSAPRNVKYTLDCSVVNRICGASVKSPGQVGRSNVCLGPSWVRTVVYS